MPYEGTALPIKLHGLLCRSWASLRFFFTNWHPMPTPCGATILALSGALS